MTPEVPYGEVCRYLGYRGGARPDAETERLIEELSGRIREAASPRYACARLPLALGEDGGVSLGNIAVRSAALRRNLDGCRGCYLFAATLGAEVDRLISRASARRVSEAAICDAAASALIEAVCDGLNERLREEALAEGLYLRPRFSPGYGDFSIEHQRDIVRVLNTPVRLGLTVTEGLMLAPAKSVTAVIGISGSPRPHERGCGGCAKDNCGFRR